MTPEEFERLNYMNDHDLLLITAQKVHYLETTCGNIRDMIEEHQEDHKRKNGIKRSENRFNITTIIAIISITISTIITLIVAWGKV